MSSNPIAIDIDDFPSPPSVALRLLELYSDESVGIDELVTSISVDPILTSRMIAYCNSPAIGLRNEAKSLRHAIVNLGTRVVKTIALSFSLTDLSGSDEGSDFDLNSFWNRSLATAVAMQKMCELNCENAEAGFLKGLLLNIGLMGKTLAQHNGICPDSINELCPFQLGAEMLEQWNLPEDVVEAIKNYASGEEGVETSMLKTANGIAEIIFDGEIELSRIEDIKKEAEEKLDVTTEAFDLLFESIVAAWQDYARLLEYDCSVAVLSEIETRARKEITSMTLNLQHENSMISEENVVLRAKAQIDPLTGLGNRHSYNERATAEWDRAKRGQRPLCLMVADIDHFKQVNDVYGHSVGDMVLRHIADLLKASCRKYDHVYRFGGEEFTLLFPDCDYQTSIMIAERLIECVNSSPFSIDGQVIQVTVSVGVGYWDGQSAMDFDELFEIADKHLYEAKNSGRNCYAPV